jgi:hypothetical protein
VAAPVAPARPAEKPLKKTWRMIRHLPRMVYYWARGTLRLTGRIIVGLTRRIRSWLRHGEGYSFLRGVPALLACGAVVWALLAPSFLRTSRTAQYALRLESALRRGELEEAELCAERLVRDTKESPFYLYAYANILYERGERNRALAIMNQLAPIDAPGYGPAQLWTARRMLAKTGLSAEETKEVEQRLLWASKEDASMRGAQALLVGYYSALGKPEWAEQHLRAGGALEANAQLKAALSFALHGDMEKA